MVAGPPANRPPVAVPGDRQQAAERGFRYHPLARTAGTQLATGHGGLEAAEDVIRRLFAPRIAALPAPETLKDAKTRLQEYLQSRGLSLPRYSVDRTEGEAHEQIFHVICDVPEIGQRAGGSGSSRRRAEQEAAERILQEIETE